MKLNHTELESFFIGTLLGDSYIRKGSFLCKQISKDLIDFKAKIISQYIPSSNVRVTEHPAYTDKNGVNHQKYYQLSTSRTEYFKKLEEYFYENGRKVYREGMASKLTPLGLALWYADDGTTVHVRGGVERRVQICTDNFTHEEHLLIKKDLEDRFGFTVKIINRRRNNQYRIGLNNMKKNQKFLIEIGYYFKNYFPSLLYKMDLGYREPTIKKRQFVLEEYETFYNTIKIHPSFINRIEG